MIIIIKLKWHNTVLKLINYRYLIILILVLLFQNKIADNLIILKSLSNKWLKNFKNQTSHLRMMKKINSIKHFYDIITENIEEETKNNSFLMYIRDKLFTNRHTFV